MKYIYNNVCEYEFLRFTVIPSNFAENPEPWSESFEWNANHNLFPVDSIVGGSLVPQ